ncbi:hypothetical protein BN1013_00134 [Candidatus Rubidus massiliensis]|nr:hypothetical protein BN1013_00134 [Candidatus Rubidus massiliensis]
MKLWIKFVFIYLIKISIALSSDILSCQDVLKVANRQFHLSTTYNEEVEKNTEIYEEIEWLVNDCLKKFPNDLTVQIESIRLLYKLGNFYLYNDFPEKAQEKLLEAKGLIYSFVNSANTIEKICLDLTAISNKLPSYLATVNYLLGKSYIYPKDILTCHNQQNGIEAIEEAIKIRQFIEKNKANLDDLEDNNVSIGNTFIIERAKGIILVAQEEWQQAEKHYLHYLKNQDGLNQLLCIKQLLHIYTQQAKRVIQEDAKNDYIIKCFCLIEQLNRFLNESKNIYRISVYYTSMANTLMELSDDFAYANFFLCSAKEKNTQDLYSISIAIQKNLISLYQKKFKKEEEKFHEIKNEFIERTCSNIFKKNKFAESSLMALGKIYGDKKQTLSAATCYSNALNCQDQSINHKELYILLYGLEKDLFFNLSKKDWLSFSDSIKSYKKELQELRKFVYSSLPFTKISYIQSVIKERYCQIIKRIIKDIQLNYTICQDNYALIAVGSLARNTCTPFSDFEFGFLIENNCSEREKETIKKLAIALAIRVSAIGETPLSYLKLKSLQGIRIEDSPSIRGFMIDPAQIQPFEPRIVTSQQLLHKIFNEKIDDFPLLQSSYLYPHFIYGKRQLLKEYHVQLKKIENEKKLNLGINLLKKDLERWQNGILNDNFEIKFSLKHNFYKPLITLLEDIALCQSIFEYNDPYKLVIGLKKAHVFSNDYANQLIDILEKINLLRVVNYSKYGSQIEDFEYYSHFHFIMKATAAIKKLQKIGKMILLKNQDFIKNQSFLSDFFISIYPVTNIEVLIHLYKQIENEFGTNHPHLSSLKFVIAKSLMKIGHYCEALYLLKEAFKIDKIIFGNTHLRLADYYIGMSECYHALGDHLLAKNIFDKGNKIFATSFQPFSRKFEKKNLEKISLNELVMPCHKNCKESFLRCDYFANSSYGKLIQFTKRIRKEKRLQNSDQVSESKEKKKILLYKYKIESVDGN